MTLTSSGWRSIDTQHVFLDGVSGYYQTRCVMMVAAVAPEAHFLLRMSVCDHMQAHRLNDGCSCIEVWLVWLVVVMFVALPVLLEQLVFGIVVMQRRRMLQLCTASW